MQSEEDPSSSLATLVHKLRKLKKRLLSYGWNKHESVHFILYSILKLPEPSWDKPSTTLAFYQVKEKYNVDSSHAELILTLRQLVPDLEKQCVLDYLHSVFQYSLLQFSLDPFRSDSDSNDNPLLVKRAAHRPRPIRHRPHQRDPSPSSRKKIRIQEQSFLPDRRVQPRQDLKLLRKRRQMPLQRPEQFQKSINKDHI